MRYQRHQNILARKIKGLIYRISGLFLSTDEMKMYGIDEYHMVNLDRAIQQTIRIVDQFKIDVLLTSSGPIAMCAIGSSVRKNRNIKWIADYQDLWSLNHNSKKYNKTKFKEYEKSLLRSADSVLTVSADFSKKISELYAGPVKTIYLGYYDIPRSKVQNTEAKLVVSYCGQIYPTFQNLEQFLESILKASNDLKNVKFIFIGQSSIVVKNYFKNKGIKQPANIDLIRQVSREESIEYQRKSDLLLLFKWEDYDQLGVLPTKFYEYIYSGKPILLYGQVKGDELGLLIKKFKLGIEVNSEESLLNFWKSLSSANFDRMRDPANADNEFSHKKQSKRLEYLIKSLVKN